MPKIDHEILLTLISYDPEAGVFYRRKGELLIEVKPCINNRGYVSFSLKGKTYIAHRLAWFYVHGEWPIEIDHVNGVRHDNRLTNIRNCVHQKNMGNTKKYKSNKSGFKGVHWNKFRNKWCACIRIHNKNTFLGHFHDINEAAEAYRQASEKYFGEFKCFTR